MQRVRCLLILMAILVVMSSLLLAQDYAGSDACKTCHSSIHDKVFQSGHPYKIQKIDGAPPVYPEGTSPGIPNTPSDITWNDVSYVIGGYGWKARFMDKEGYILTGDTERQYNITNSNLGTEAGWGGYDAGTAPKKPYTCGTCHTTGWVATGEAGPHQDDLPGIHGTWSEPGVTCEGCHGPSAAHAANPSSTKPSKEEKCGECHSRGDVNQIDVSGGLVQHHEQYEDLLASPHKAFKCGTCHKPHLSTKYGLGGYKGDDATCKTCHASKEIKLAVKQNFACNSCHMPYAAKSAVKIDINYADGTVAKGDIRSHIKRLSTDPDWNWITDDGKFVRLDADGKAYLPLEMACLTCHTSKTKSWAYDNAMAIHNDVAVVSEPDIAGTIPVEFALLQNYPNPFNPTTTIPFELKEGALVEIRLFNSIGREIALLMNEARPAGHHEVTFSAHDFPSGVYIYQIRADEFVASKKMMLVR